LTIYLTPQRIRTLQIGLRAESAREVDRA